MNKFNSFLIGLISIGVGGLLMYFYLNSKGLKEIHPNQPEQSTNTEQQAQSVFSQHRSNEIVDLREAAKSAVRGVVHVKTLGYTETYSRNPIMDFFYGYNPQRSIRKVIQAGSGVIISSDGYIITNNHVIENAEKISVTLYDNRNFIARLIGNDRNTDLALLKVDGVSDLDTIAFANSDEVSLGEWVLAVGNPFDLTSTVTSGIVSAKARSIKKSARERLSLDAFIQTDAAVNSGNSGGALVNSKGKLIGINTAIESSTGAYIGYSFAIPSNIVAKVTQDLRMYGEVQRAFLGVEISTVTNQLASMHNLEKVEGIFIHKVVNGGAAQIAGLQEGDVIIDINGLKTNTVEQFQEQIGKYSPEDTVTITIRREGLTKHFELQLGGDLGRNSQTINNKILGAKLKPTDVLNEIQGVQVVELTNGKLRKAGIKKSFIIQKINNINIRTLQDLDQILEDNVLHGIFLIEGQYPNGDRLSAKIF